MDCALLEKELCVSGLRELVEVAKVDSVGDRFVKDGIAVCVDGKHGCGLFVDSYDLDPIVADMPALSGFDGARIDETDASLSK